jgi:ribonuclease D
LLRPIKPALIEYAVNDVLKLLEIENGLAARLVEKGLYESYINTSRAASKKEYSVNPHALYLTKFPGYARLPFERKKMAAGLWIFRELLGEKFDCPVGYLMSRKTLASIINSGGEIVAAIDKEINRERKQNKRLPAGTIRELFERAMQSPHIPQKPVIKRRSLRRRD